MINTQRISSDSLVKQALGNIVSDMSGEKVMMNVGKGKYYNLGSIGGEIWSLIEEKIFVRELVTALVQIYNVEDQQCEEQVISFLSKLSNEGLIEITE